MSCRAVCDLGVIDGAERTTDEESFAIARRLIPEESLLVGGSSGITVAAALWLAARGNATDRSSPCWPTPGTGISSDRGCGLMRDGGAGRRLDHHHRACCRSRRTDNLAESSLPSASASLPVTLEGIPWFIPIKAPDFVTSFDREESRRHQA